MFEHILSRFFSPDDSSGAAPGSNDHKSPDISLPEDIDNLAYLAGNVSAKWMATSQITMVDHTAAGFNMTVTNLQTALGARHSAGGTRPNITLSLEHLDALATEGTKKIKAYLVGKFEDEEVAQANYARYGIVKESGNYRLPSDRQSRLAALDMTLAAISADGFGSKEYGTAWWTDYKTNLDKALTAASDSDKAVSGGAADISGLEAEVRFVLTGLRFILRGNYQKTYKQVWREWGFQAEDY